MIFVKLLLKYQLSSLFCSNFLDISGCLCLRSLLGRCWLGSKKIPFTRITEQNRLRSNACDSYIRCQSNDNHSIEWTRFYRKEISIFFLSFETKRSNICCSLSLHVSSVQKTDENRSTFCHYVETSIE